MKEGKLLPARNLLSNGLPFEIIVAKQLSDLGLFPGGVYSFPTIYPDRHVERSIDNR